LAVYNPFERRNIICRNGNKTLFLIWIFGSLYAFCGSKDIKTFPFKPPNLFNQSEDQMLKNTTWFVCSSQKTIWNTKMFMTSNFVITFLFPLIIITVCYLLIAKKLINNRNAEKDKPLRRNSGGSGDTFKVSVNYDQFLRLIKHNKNS
jgi:hypothetical protein